MGKKEIKNIIEGNRTFLITGHLNPDGDSLACQLALAVALEQLNKSVSLQSNDPVPVNYHWLPAVERIQQVEMPQGTFDVAVMIECATLERSGFSSVPAQLIIGIDHHPDYQLAADADWLDVDAAATAELVHELILDLGCHITKPMAQLLYTGLMTDSGMFVYPKTRPKTLETAAELMRAGADPTLIAQKVYRSYPAARLDLMRDLFAGMTRHCGGKLAVMSIDQATLESKSYTNDLFDEIVNFPLSVKTVFYSALAREASKDVWRFSLRSKNEADVGAVAREFGGGGHRNAAGFRAEGNLEEIIDSIVEKISRLERER